MRGSETLLRQLSRSRAAWLGLLIACLVPCQYLHAAGPKNGGSGKGLRITDLLPFLQQNPPQVVVPAGTQGTVVDPSHLEEPVRLERTLRNAMRDKSDNVHLTVTNGTAHVGTSVVKADEVVHGHLVVLKGNAEVHGKVEGNVIALDGDIVLSKGAQIVGDALSIGGNVDLNEGSITGAITTLEPSPELVIQAGSIPGLIARRSAGLLGLFFTMVVLGFAMVTFARPNLEIVSDTVSHSLGRSFTAGLLGEMLVLPSIGLIVVGLAITLIGTVLVPFALAVFSLLIIAALLSGILAVAYNMGETITRRRMARGIFVSPNAYRYVLTGLAGLGTVWLAWVVFGWVPVAGPLMLAVAMLSTWVVGTIGFGAALLSRGGVREHFAGRLLAPIMMTDEHLWATPRMGVPIVKRPPKEKS